MQIINLRDFYPWYSCDEFVEATDDVAAELFADKRGQETYERNKRRNKVCSLDAQDGAEASATACYNDSPETVLERMERYCALCRALNSLPETQGRRIDAHYILRKSRGEIAKAEHVNESSVNRAIGKGLAQMKKYLQDF